MVETSDFYRMVHWPLPVAWEGLPGAGVVDGSFGDTGYLSDNASMGVRAIIGGAYLEVCVREHLLYLGKRKPVRDGRVALYLSRLYSIPANREPGDNRMATDQELNAVISYVYGVAGVRVSLFD